MMNSRSHSRAGQGLRKFFANLCFLLAAVALVFAFSRGTNAVAAAPTASQLLQSNLPSPKTLANASKPEVIAAVLAAMKNSAGNLSSIIKATVEARKELTADIVTAAIRSLGPKPDCRKVAEIVRGAIAGNPDAASKIMEIAWRLTPDCRSEIEQAGANAGGANASGESGDNTGANFENAPTNQNPPPGSFAGGGGGFDPQEGRVVICHNGQTLVLPPKAAEKHLRNHPGDRPGACNPTPTTNP